MKDSRVWKIVKIPLFLLVVLGIPAGVVTLAVLAENEAMASDISNAQEFAKLGQILPAEAVERNEESYYNNSSEAWDKRYDITHEYYIPGTDTHGRISKDVERQEYDNYL